MKYKSFLISAHLGEKRVIIIDSSRWYIINLSVNTSWLVKLVLILSIKEPGDKNQ